MPAAKGFTSPIAKAVAAAWDAITGKPSTFPPSTHTHAFADITGKPADYPPSAHTHAYADITGKPSTFAPSGHSHPISDITGLQTALDGKGTGNNVQFTGSVTLGAIIAIGAITKDVTVNGVLAGDRINVAPIADLPAGIVLLNGRPNGANTVRLYFNVLAILTNNTPQSIAITALR